jgi:hypothetical protein
MDLTGRVLVVLGFAAGAVTGVMAVVALLTIVGGGVDAHAHLSQLLLAVGGAAGAVVGARVNRASGQALLSESASYLA